MPPFYQRMKFSFSQSSSFRASWSPVSSAGQPRPPDGRAWVLPRHRAIFTAEDHALCETKWKFRFWDPSIRQGHQFVMHKSWLHENEKFDRIHHDRTLQIMHSTCYFSSVSFESQWPSSSWLQISQFSIKTPFLIPKCRRNDPPLSRIHFSQMTRFPAGRSSQIGNSSKFARTRERNWI